MRVFISHRSKDKEEVDILLKDVNGLDIQSHRTLETSDEIWKEKVSTKMMNSDIVLFFLGSTVNESKPVSWEFDLAKKLQKKCFAIKLKNGQVPYYIKDIEFINSQPKQIESTLSNSKLISTDKLLIEQYKIMVSSTEKVTEQRLKVNNLFITVTTSLLSISALVGKLIGFENKNTAMLAVGIMLFFSIVAFVISFFWQKLINSYGKLNTGKFTVINEIENQLQTNLFQREWQILQKDVGYKSNTKTETTIIIWFRIFIIVIGLIEILYLINRQFNLF